MKNIQAAENKRRKGLTLTELAIVLGAMGLVMGAVWAVIGSVWDNYHFNKMNEQVMEVVQNVRTNFGPKGKIKFGNADVLDDRAITADIDADTFRLLPVEMRTTPKVAGSAIQHALAMGVPGSFEIDRKSAGTVFRVILRGLSKSSCINMLTQFPVTMPELGVIYLETGAGSIGPFDSRNPSTLTADLPVKVTKAESLCDKTTNTNVVSYDFRLFP